MDLTLEPKTLGQNFAPGAIGISLETRELATRDLSASHKSLVALMRHLGPGVLRIGGNTLDYSWWTSVNEPPPAWATSVVTPSNLFTLHGLLAATGWRAILGVDLGHFDPNRAANEISVAEHILGSGLLGVEVGNEPNAYGTPAIKLRPSSYRVGNYLDELHTYGVAINAVDTHIKIYGPDLSALAWLPSVAADSALPLGAITLHFYPTSYNVSKGACTTTPLPTALDLLSPAVREREDTVLQALIGAGNAAQRETRISETNTTSSCGTGGGADTSPVFASALWSLDWVLRSASAGVSGLNFHGSFGRCAPGSFNPICAPSDAARARGQVTARPEFYGLLAARQLQGGRFIPAHITSPSPPGDFTVYATKHPNNTITLAIDNFKTSESPSFILDVTGYRRATDETLAAPSISSTSDVTFGHAPLSSTGALRARRKHVSRLHGHFRLRLTPASATVVTLYR